MTIINQILKTSWIFIVLSSGLCAIFAGTSFSLFFLGGECWGVVNFYIIAQMAQSFLIDKKRFYPFLMLFIKFPLLYGMGYYLLINQGWNPWLFIGGFSIIFLQILYKVLTHQSVRAA